MPIGFIDNSKIIQINNNHGISGRVQKNLFKPGHCRIPVKKPGKSIVFIGINDPALWVDKHFITFLHFLTADIPDNEKSTPAHACHQKGRYDKHGFRWHSLQKCCKIRLRRYIFLDDWKKIRACTVSCFRQNICKYPVLLTHASA